MQCYNCNEELLPTDNRDDEICKPCEQILFPVRNGETPTALDFDNDKNQARVYEPEYDVYSDGTFNDE